MAKTLPTQYEAVVALKAALAAGELSSEEVRIALAQFSFLRDLSAEFRDQLEAAGSEEELKRVLEVILDRAENVLTEAPALRESVAVEPMEADEVAAIARAHSAARSQADAARKKARGDMRSLIERSVAKYAGRDVEALMSRLTAEAEESPSIKDAARAISRIVGERVDEASLSPVWQEARREKLARELIIEHPTLPTIETAVKTVLTASGTPDASETTKHIAVMRARAEAVLDVPREDSGQAPLNNVTGAGNFFRSLPDQNVLQRALAPVADIVVSVFPQRAREAIVAAVISNSFERGVEKLTRTLGEKAFVDMRFAMGPRLIAAEDQKAAASSALSGVQKFLSGTVGTIFQKPMDEAAVAYLTHIHEKAVGVVSWQQAYVYRVYPTHPHVFHLEFLHDLGGWAVRLGARRAAGKIASAGAGKIAAEGAKKGFGAILAKLGISAAGAAATGGTSLLGQAALWLGGSLFGRALGGMKSLFAGLVGAGGGNQKATDWAIAGIIAAVVFLPMIMFSLGDVARTAPLATSVGGVPSGPIVDCARSPEEPICQYTACPDCEWPTSGYITQGPRTCGNQSHAGSNSIDIGSPYQTPVHTITGGTVFGRSTTTCADTPESGVKSRTYGCNSGYGNWIDIRSPEGYILRYAHLANGSIPLSVGAPVKKGDQIGRVDNNGNSSGHHLHFEVRSGPNILSFLPLDFVAKYQNQLEGCEARVCNKACPPMQ